MAFNILANVMNSNVADIIMKMKYKLEFDDVVSDITTRIPKVHTISVRCWSHDCEMPLEDAIIGVSYPISSINDLYCSSCNRQFYESIRESESESESESEI